MDRVLTGSDPLDAALGGGLPCGASILVEGPQGMGSTELALTLLRATAAGAHAAVFATALRSPARARKEVAALFRDEKAAGIEFRAIQPANARSQCLQAILSMGRGDVLVLESAAALARTPGGDLLALVEEVSNAAHEVGAVVACLHAPGTLPAGVEQAIGETLDGVFSFHWRDGGPTRRRVLLVNKLRGLAPMLDGEQVPVFEASLQIGVGFAVTRVKNVV